MKSLQSTPQFPIIWGNHHVWTELGGTKINPTMIHSTPPQHHSPSSSSASSSSSPPLPSPPLPLPFPPSPSSSSNHYMHTYKWAPSTGRAQGGGDSEIFTPNKHIKFLIFTCSEMILWHHEPYSTCTGSTTHSFKCV